MEKKNKALIGLIIKRLDIFSFSLLLLIFLLKKSKIAWWIWAKYQKIPTNLYIYQKLATQIISNFVLNFSSRKHLKIQKKFYISRRENDLESYLSFTNSTTSGLTSTWHLIEIALNLIFFLTTARV